MKKTTLIIMLAIAPAWASEKSVTVTTSTVTTEAVTTGAVTTEAATTDAVATPATPTTPATAQSGDTSTTIEQVFVVDATIGDEEGSSSGDKKRIKIITRIETQGDENRGWLGVALGVTDTQPEDGDQSIAMNAAMGQVEILNVVKDSPAERAGLQVGDVVKSLNGEPVEGVGGMALAIGELGPGSIANLEIQRDHQAMNIAVTLTTPQKGDIEWRQAPDAEFTEHFRALPHIMRLSTGGDMQTLNLEDLAELNNLPGNIAEIIASLNSGATTQLSFGNGERILKISREENGEALEISQEGDGPITVKRSTDNGSNTSETEYANTDALKTGDPEAFDLYNQHQPTAIFLGDDGSGTSDFTFSFDPSANDGNLQHIHEMVAEQLRNANATVSNADATAQALREKFMHFERAAQTFKVNPDGQIELTIRKGDTEIVKIFTDEADLEARDPDAFQRYQEIVSPETEPQP